MNSQAYEEGWNAFDVFASSPYDNPYPLDTSEYWDWNDGYGAASLYDPQDEW